MMCNGEPVDMFGILVGAGKYINDYKGAKRSPNVTLLMTGPSYKMTLVVSTQNHVGVAAKSELFLNYGLAYDLTRQLGTI